jgi:CubicO group peptidase (beta-lactamase class C family)
VGRVIDRRTFLIGAGRGAAGLAALSSLQAGDPWTALISRLDQLVPQLMTSARLPGLSLALVRDGRLHWRRAFGVKDAVSRAPVDHDTVFEAASMSKPVFAYAVMKLRERGLLDLDRPLTKYTTARFLKGDSRLDLITARQILSHTAGFQNWRSDAAPLKIHFTPGERYQYSGEGYSYLQSVVTHLAGEAFDPFMRRVLLAPFGMEASGYVWNDHYERHMARPHDTAGGALDNQKNTADSVARYGSAGALLSTPTDFAKFLCEVIAPGPADAFRLSRASLEEMVRPVVKLDDGTNGSWALGWRIQPTEKGDFVMHGGDNEGFHCVAVASPSLRNGYVVMTNGESGVAVLPKVMEPINAALVA